jgi:hypothetical protein
MNNSLNAGRQHGLTLWQWGLLFAAFMLGLGCTFVVREVFLSASAHAGIVQTAPVNTVAFR